MKTSNSNDENKTIPVAFPNGRWSSVPVRVEILRYMIGADEIKARAIEQLVKQGEKEAGI